MSKETLLQFALHLVGQCGQQLTPKERLDATIEAYKKIYRTLETYYPEKD